MNEWLCVCARHLSIYMSGSRFHHVQILRGKETDEELTFTLRIRFKNM